MKRKNSPPKSGPSSDGKRWLTEATSDLKWVLKGVERCTDQVEALAKLFEQPPGEDRDQEIMRRASMLETYARAGKRRFEDVRKAGARMKGEEVPRA